MQSSYRSCKVDRLSSSRLTKKSYSTTFFDKFTKSRSDSLKQRIATHLLGKQVDVSYEAFIGLPKPVLKSNDFLLDQALVTDPQEAISDYCRLASLQALFSKDVDLKSPIDRDDVALQSFMEAERSCENVNTILDGGKLCYLLNGTDASAILHYARLKIASIIGDVPSISDLDLSFGPGANTSCRRITSARFKLSADPSISNSLLQNNMLFQTLLQELPHIVDAKKTWRVQPGKLEFVPKNYKTSRSICIEPIYSSMLQRGYGTFLKQKLKRNGIDLYDQSINRSRAKSASILDGNCTIDLERASDSISTNIVRELLPFDWFDTLSSVRSDFITLPSGETIEPHKFSSMGNGYTFELESLIFYGLSWGLSRHFSLPFDFTVYGDDIITTKALTAKIMEYFPIFGFSVNREKSFISGSFRESCGCDAFHGVDVRPFFWKDRASYALITNYYNFLSRNTLFDSCHTIRTMLLEEIPENCRTYGPDGYGDGHLLGDFKKPNRTAAMIRDGWTGYYFRTIVSKPESVYRPLPLDYILPSYIASSRKSCTFLRKEIKLPPIKWITEDHCLHKEERELSMKLHAKTTNDEPSKPFSIRSLRLKGKWIEVYILG